MVDTVNSGLYSRTTSIYFSIWLFIRFVSISFIANCFDSCPCDRLPGEEDGASFCWSYEIAVCCHRLIWLPSGNLSGGIFKFCSP